MMRKTWKRITVAGLAALLLLAAMAVVPAANKRADAAFAIGSLLASDSFTGTTGAWEGASGGAGWGENWKTQYADSTIPGYNIANTTALAFDNLKTDGNYAVGGINYSSIGRLFDLTSTSPFKPYLSGSGTSSIGRSGDTLYVGFLVRKETNSDEAVYGNLHNSTVSYNTASPLVAAGYFGTASNSGGSRYWSLRVGSTVYRTNQQVVAGQAALMVLKIQFSGTSKVSLFVNPTSLAGADPLVADQTQTTTTNLAFRSFQYYGGSSPGLGSLDEVRVGNTYASVTPTKVYEAENATLTGPNTVLTTVAGYTGTGYVRTPLNNEAATMTFTIDAPAAGTYFIAIRYNSSASLLYGPTKSLYANGVKLRQIKFKGLYESGGGWNDRIESVPLNAGSNTIAINNETGDTQTMNIDSISLLSRLPDTGFTVDGTQIVAPDGSDFLVKGVNSSGPDFANFYEYTASGADLMSRVWKFNAVRINMNMSVSYSDQNDDLDEIVNEFSRRGMVVMLEAHDFTGTFPTTTGKLTQLENYWAGKAAKYKDNPYVWFNIMNEPGPVNSTVSSYWKTDHEAVIQAIRGAGADNVIVLDENGYGQAGGGSDATKSGALTYGQYFTSNYDNIVFSLHLYDSFNTNGQTNLQTYVDAVQTKDLALIFGEYGMGYDSSSTVKTIKATTAMFNVAIPEGIGRMAWHWSGSDSINQLVELEKADGGFEINAADGVTRPGNLNWLGELVWDDTHGMLAANQTDVSLGELYADKAVFAYHDVLKFATTVRNSGMSDLSGTDTVKVNFRVNGSIVSTKTINGPLKAGDAVTVVSDSNYANANFTLSADIDSTSSYGTDAVSANNSRTVYLNGAAGTGGPDLTITDITSDQPNVAYGVEVQLGAVVKNQGSTAVTNRPVTVVFGMNGSEIRNDVNKQIKVTQNVSLNAGDSVTITPPLKWIVKFTQDAHVTAKLIDTAADTNVTNQKRYKTFAYDPLLTNFVGNPGFESVKQPQNTVNVWVNYGRLAPTTTTVHSGTYAGLVYGGGVGGGGQYMPDLQPNTTYTIEAWGMNAATPSANSDIGVQWNNPDSTTTKQILHFTETTWTHKTLTFTTPSSFTLASVFVYKNDPAADFYADDISVR